MRPGEPDRTRHQERHVPLHSFLGGVASPESIKDCSLHALDQLLNSTNHMSCIWGTVNRRNMQYFTDLKRRTPILDVPPLIGQGTDDQAETQLVHHRVLVGMHRHLGLGYDVAHRVKELVKGCYMRPRGCSYVVCIRSTLQGFKSI